MLVLCLNRRFLKKLMLRLPKFLAPVPEFFDGLNVSGYGLFVGLDMVERHVPAAVADDRLIELIRSHGRWVDPPATALAGAPGQGGVV